MRWPTALTLTFLAGCAIPSEGPMMHPGRDCLECHSAGGGAEPAWTVAGTVYARPDDPPAAGVRGVRVHLADASGRTLVLRTNAAGNFYTRERLQFPLATWIEKDGVVRAMPEPVPHGGCNGCHALPPPEPGPGGRVALVGGTGGSPLMNPGEDCLACHLASGGPPFGAAGTVYLREDAAADQGVDGVTIRILGATGALTTLRSNAAGNFYTSDDIVFPAQVEIEGGGIVRQMEEDLTHGSCNACHAPGGEGRVALTGGDD